MDLAAGMLAKLKGVPLCPRRRAGRHAVCSSRVGTATVGAGAGAPFFVKGGVYLTGPVQGRAVRPGRRRSVLRPGPFDLGDVVVRQALMSIRSTRT